VRISKYALSILFLMAAFCVAAHAQNAPTGGGGSNAPQQPPAIQQSNQPGSQSIRGNSASADSYVPAQPAEAESTDQSDQAAEIEHPAYVCVTRQHPRLGCKLDDPGEKGSACQCPIGDVMVPGRLE